jgi:hypothetical protein
MPDATTFAVPAVDQVFAQTVAAVRDRLDEIATRNRAHTAANPQFVRARVDVVDLELTFKNVVLDGKSTLAKLLVADTQTTSTLELKLTTRIRIEA